MATTGIQKTQGYKHNHSDTTKRLICITGSYFDNVHKSYICDTHKFV